MTTNQQLKDYITQQTKLGVSKETMKSALLGAGWNEGDVSQAIAEYESGLQSAAPISSAQPVSSVQQPSSVQSPVTQSPVSSAGVSAPATKPMSTFVTSDIFQPKGEAVFKSTAGIQPGPQTQKPQTVSINNESPVKKGGKIVTIALGVVSVILLGGNVYFYFQNNGLRSQVVTPGAAGPDSAVAQQAAQITSLTADKDNLTQQISSFNKTIADLTSQLSIFEPASTSSITSVSFDVSGILGGGGKVLYSLTTSKNIVLTVKNSKDADIEAVLKLLTGKQIELAGTHQPGSVQLTVATINGQSPKDALSALTVPQAATSSTQTSTAPATPSAAIQTSPTSTSVPPLTAPVSLPATSTTNATGTP